MFVSHVWQGGWGSSLKVLETQKQLQAKKSLLQNAKVCKYYAVPSSLVGYLNYSINWLFVHTRHENWAYLISCRSLLINCSTMCFLQKKPSSTLLAPVIDLKGRRGGDDNPPGGAVRFNQVTGKVSNTLC